MLTDMFRVGVITSTHGLKGEVKIFPTTEDPKRFSDLKEVLAVHGESQKALSIESVRYFKNLVILRFKDHHRIEDVERYKKWELYVRREDAIPLEEGEYYVPDLIGLTVQTMEGRVLGTLRDVLETGANDVYAVHRGEGQKDLLIPAIKSVIKNISLEEGLMEVELIPGLEEL